MVLNNILSLAIYFIAIVEIVRLIDPLTKQVIKLKRRLGKKGEFNIIASKILKINKEVLAKEECRNCYLATLCHQSMDELALEHFTKEEIDAMMKQNVFRGKYSRRKDKDDEVFQAYELFILMKT